MKKVEIEYNEDLWNSLREIAVYQGGSLHVDHWIAKTSEGVTYHLYHCSGDFKSIEKEV